ncbi:MAG: hypothetical protein ACRCW2_08255 [Cellulosilyticaceae bacterium]
MNNIKKIPCRVGLSLFIILQVFAYALDVRGLKILAFYNEGLEMQVSIMAIVIPMVVEGIVSFILGRKSK